MKRWVMILMLAGSLAPLAGCIIVPGGGYHRHWVPGYYGAYGAWHPGHWN